MSNMFGMLQKAQEMQAKLKTLQAELAATTFVGTAGGLVTVEMNGTHEVTAVKIDPQALVGGDAALLEDLVLTAAKQALQHANETAKRKMSEVTGGLNLPGGLGF